MLPLLLSTVALANPWVRAPGTGYAKAGGAVFLATEYVDPQVDAPEEADYVGYTGSVYAEVGVVPGAHAIVSLPYTLGRSRDPETGWRYSTRGLGDALVGVEVDAPRLDLPASIGVRARLPMYDGAARPELYPALGDEQMDLDLYAGVGRGGAVGRHGAWGLVEAGWRWRSSWAPSGNAPPYDYANGLPYRAQIGWTPTTGGGRSLGWISLEASGLFNLADSDVTRRWHQWNAGLAAALVRGLHLELGAQQIYAASASSKGWSFSGGLSLLF